jgi:hypothetical protein
MAKKQDTNDKKPQSKASKALELMAADKKLSVVDAAKQAGTSPASVYAARKKGKGKKPKQAAQFIDVSGGEQIAIVIGSLSGLREILTLIKQ